MKKCERVPLTAKAIGNPYVVGSSPTPCTTGERDFSIQCDPLNGKELMAAWKDRHLRRGSSVVEQQEKRWTLPCSLTARFLGICASLVRVQPSAPCQGSSVGRARNKVFLKRRLQQFSNGLLNP